MKNKQQFTLWYYLGAIILFFAVQSYFAREHVGVLPYSDLKTLVQAGKVSDVTIGSETIAGTVDLTGVETLLPAPALETLKKQTAARTPAGQPDAQRPTTAQHRIIARRVEDPQLTAMLDAAKVRSCTATSRPAPRMIYSAPPTWRGI